MDAVSAADAALATNRGQVIDIVLGTNLVSSGLTACAIAAIRSGRCVRILVWWRVWSASSNVAMTKTDNTTKDFRFVEHPRSSKYIKVVIVVTVAKSPRH
jgi:hypothetical protein